MMRHAMTKKKEHPREGVQGDQSGRLRPCNDVDVLECPTHHLGSLGRIVSARAVVRPTVPLLLVLLMMSIT